MKFSSIYLFLLLIILPNIAFAEENRIAVLEFKSIGIKSDILLKLSDQSRRAAVDVLPPDTFQIMTRENMLQILEDDI